MPFCHHTNQDTVLGDVAVYLCNLSCSALALPRYKITLSYLQLYMEAVLDLLEPEKDQLAITEDPTTGEVTANGAKVVEVSNMEGLLQILKVLLTRTIDKSSSNRPILRRRTPRSRLPYSQS